MITPYMAICVQSQIRAVRDAKTAKQTIRENLYRMMALVEYSAKRFGKPRLVVLPEFSLTGATHDKSVEEFIPCLPTVPGDETEELGKLAREYSLYIAGATMEYDPTWPHRWWNCAYVVGPEGNVILKYRKIHEGNQNGVLSDTTSTDVYDEYVRRYGKDALFPVVDTEIGKLACCICYDVNFPELARTLALKGAEVICHPTGEPHNFYRDSWEQGRRSRAWENSVYWLSANHGAYISPAGEDKWMDSDPPLFQERTQGEFNPMFRSRGMSEIVSYDGTVVAIADGQGEALITGIIDIEALRYHKSQPTRFYNFLPQVRTKQYAPVYAKTPGWPLNRWLDKPLVDKKEGLDTTLQLLEQWYERGIFKRPDPTLKPYTIAALQSNIHHIDDFSKRDEIIKENCDRSLELAEMTIRMSDAKVIVFPEFWLQGFEPWYSQEDWLNTICFDSNGRELAPVREFAAKHGVYLSGAFFEVDKEWPGRWFDTAFIFGPNGETALRYRKLNCGNLFGLVNDTMPGDVYTEYVKKYGEDALFPTVDTPYGTLACIICFDINFFEQARCLTYNGAEVILHPTGEPQGWHWPSWQSARRARAYENMAYLVSANAGSYTHSKRPHLWSHGHSQVVDFYGKVIAQTPGPGESLITAPIDINALRYRRQTPINWLLNSKPELWAKVYEELEACPVDLWADHPLEPGEGIERFKENIHRLQKKGIFVPPSAERVRV